MIKTLQEKIKADTGKSIEEFRTEKLNLENKISVIESSLKEYNFFEINKDIEKELIGVIEKINILLAKYHSDCIQLEKIKLSCNSNVDFDLDKIRKLYNDTLANFGDFVKKTIDEAINFKKSLLENRNKYLQKEVKRISDRISETLEEIRKEEIKRSQLFARIKEKGSLDKIEKTYEQLLIEKTTLERNTAIVGEIEDISEIISNDDISLAQLKNDTIKDIKFVESEIDKLRLLFQEILKNTIYIDKELENSFFDINFDNSSKKNQMPFKILVEIPKDDALGQERLKIVAYDLMTFINNRKNSRKNPDFLIHDGVYHAISNKTLVNVLN